MERRSDKRRIERNGEKRWSLNDCFYFVRVHRTRLAVHLNMITKHKVISKAVCGKLVGDN